MTLTEYEITNTAGMAFGNGMSSFTVFFSLVTAYLVAAHMAGRSLSRPQVIIVNVCYFFAAVFFGATTVVFFLRGMQMSSAAQRIETVTSLQVANNWGWGWQWVALIVVVVLTASFYFMWTVRHPKD